MKTHKYSLLLNGVIILVAVSTYFFAHSFKPIKLLADTLPSIHLEADVPLTIAEWTALPGLKNQIVNPSKTKLEDEIYSQILERVYTNPEGYRIMFTIAYGKRQDDSLSLHSPEACYPAQGFKILERSTDFLKLDGHSIEIKQLVTRFQNRVEPVSYWTMIGDQQNSGLLGRKYIQFLYTLDGFIPDGMLIRVSSIDVNAARAFKEQKRFVSEFANAIATQNKARYLGKD